MARGYLASRYFASREFASRLLGPHAEPVVEAVEEAGWRGSGGGWIRDTWTLRRKRVGPEIGPPGPAERDRLVARANELTGVRPARRAREVMAGVVEGETAANAATSALLARLELDALATRWRIEYNAWLDGYRKAFAEWRQQQLAELSARLIRQEQERQAQAYLARLDNQRAADADAVLSLLAIEEEDLALACNELLFTERCKAVLDALTEVRRALMH